MNFQLFEVTIQLNIDVVRLLQYGGLFPAYTHLNESLNKCLKQY